MAAKWRAWAVSSQWSVKNSLRFITSLKINSVQFCKVSIATIVYSLSFNGTINWENVGMGYDVMGSVWSMMWVYLQSSSKMLAFP